MIHIIVVMSPLHLCSLNGNDAGATVMIKYNHNLLVIATFALLGLTTAQTATSADKESLWSSLKSAYFGDRTVHENANDLLIITAPKRAEDAAIVPISVKSLIPQTTNHYIKNIHIVIDKNPEPYSANFRLSPALSYIDIATRMRVDQYTFVRAIAEMNDGSLHMVSRFVKAAGGCSAPAMKDAAAAMASLGKMQIRMREPTIGETLQVQVIVSHPNYNGLQFSQKNHRYINAHHVKKIDIRYNGESLINVATGISVSENPSVRFAFIPKENGTLSVDVVDSQNLKFNLQRNI